MARGSKAKSPFAQRSGVGASASIRVGRNLRGRLMACPALSFVVRDGGCRQVETGEAFIVALVEKFRRGGAQRAMPGTIRTPSKRRPVADRRRARFDHITAQTGAPGFDGRDRRRR